MDIRQLELFVGVADQRSFTRAAHELHIVQPAISIAIKKLEEKLGVTLFDRSDKQASLTPEGKVLYRHAKTILRQRFLAEQEMKELRGLEQGEVRIAMPAMHASYHFPDIFCEFKKAYPGLHVYVEEAGTTQVQQAILNGSIELGVVMIDEAPDSLEVRPFLNEQMVALVSAEHTFSKLKSVSFSRFAREPLAVTREGYFMRETINRLSQQHNITPNIQFEANLMLLTKKLVLESGCVSTCMSMVLEKEPELIGVPFKPPIHFHTGIAWRKNSYLSKPNQAFVDFLLGRKNPQRANDAQR
jgi:DNA-binding transcriptional LysR family regulator